MRCVQDECTDIEQWGGTHFDNLMPAAENAPRVVRPTLHGEYAGHHHVAFTLVELLVSVVILGIGLIAVSQLYLSAVWTMQKARYLAVASERAQHEMELIQGLGYRGLICDPLIAPERFSTSEYHVVSTGRGVQFDEEGLPGGRGTIAIIALPDHPGLLRVTVDIYWDGPPRSQTKVHLTTLISTSPTGGSE